MVSHFEGHWASPKRIFIDCTDTYNNGMNTGIQRVVRNIANNCASLGENLGITCQPVILVGNNYSAISTIDHRGVRQSKFALRSAVNRGYFLFVQRLATALPHAWQRFLTGNKHEASLARVISFMFLPLLWVMRKTRRAAAFSSPAVQFGVGDILLLADCVWNYSPWAVVHSASSAGAAVAAVVYDIIPATHGQFFAASSRERFLAALPLLFESSDTFICISTYTKTQLHSYFAAQPYSQTLATKKFSTFTLGVELDTIEFRGSIREKILSVFSLDRSVYLVVGTLEPRKNHAYLLEVFQALWREGSTAALLIVGRIGWMCEEILDAIQRHHRAGRQLFFMDDVTDTELDYCYTHARALLFPAMVEGFGLPMIEALKNGLPVFASDIPVFREVGGEYATYFDPVNPSSLKDLLQTYESTGVYPALLPDGFSWPDWSQSTEELLTQLAALASFEEVA